MQKSEWALIMGAVTALLDWLVGFQLSGLSATGAAAIIAVISAVAALVVALRTRPVAPSVFMGLIGAVVSLLAAYGLHFSQQSVASFSMVIVTIMSLILRGHISPTADAPHTGVLGNRPA